VESDWRTSHGRVTVAWHPARVPTPLSCSNSLLPVRHLQAGEEAVCEFCRAKLRVVAPPARAIDTHDESLRKLAK